VVAGTEQETGVYIIKYAQPVVTGLIPAGVTIQKEALAAETEDIAMIVERILAQVSILLGSMLLR